MYVIIFEYCFMHFSYKLSILWVSISSWPGFRHVCNTETVLSVIWIESHTSLISFENQLWKYLENSVSLSDFGFQNAIPGAGGLVQGDNRNAKYNSYKVHWVCPAGRVSTVHSHFSCFSCQNNYQPIWANFDNYWFVNIL